MRVERMIEMDVAKPFSMLSANLITAAMTKPPKAYRSMWSKYKTQITMWHRSAYVRTFSFVFWRGRENVPEEPPQSTSHYCTLERVHSQALFLHRTQTPPEVQKSVQIHLRWEGTSVMKEIWMVAHKHTHFLKPDTETHKQWLQKTCFCFF